MLKALLDGHIYDKFEADSASADLLKATVASGKIIVLMPRVVQDELAARPAGVPCWLPVAQITDGVFVAGISIAGAARVGGGGVFESHLGESRKAGPDAVIAATAHSDADVLVSEDNRCRERAKQFTRCECLTFDQFITLLKSL
jgi:hypothetical protein